MVKKGSRDKGNRGFEKIWSTFKPKIKILARLLKLMWFFDKIDSSFESFRTSAALTGGLCMCKRYLPDKQGQKMTQK